MTLEAGTRVGQGCVIHSGVRIANSAIGDRTVVLDQQAMDVLRAWRERRSLLGISGHHPFFCATYGEARGSKLDPSHYRRLIKRLARKAGVEKRCHLHGLRHTGASEMLEEGIGLATISAQLGHKNISTTQCYIDVNDDMKRRAVELV